MNSAFSKDLTSHYIPAFISILIGVFVFGHYFDFTVIEPSNTAWIMRLQGDYAQHYLGSVAFRADEWYFPLTKTTYIDSPEGISIVYTDSNPLFAILAKAFRFVFLPTYQYAGFWYLLCFCLQSFFGYLLIKKITQNTIFALLAGTLFCLMPPLIDRKEHENLMAFWLILWTLYIFIDTEFSHWKKSFLFFLVTIISGSIHGYICIMVLLISGTWYSQQLITLLKKKDIRELLRFILINAGYASVLVVTLWILGYFYNAPARTGLLGFGIYSMNLIAPLNPLVDKYSSFIDPVVVNHGQNEGFQYWGLGVILLFLFVVFKYLNKKSIGVQNTFVFFLLSIVVVIFLLKNNESSFYERSLLALVTIIYSSIVYILYRERSFNYLLLFIPATFCFILALSNIVTFGENTIFEYMITNDSILAGFCRTIRSSGRLFWVTTMILILSVLFLLFNMMGARKSIATLALLVFIQYIDLYKVTYVVDSKNKEYTSPLSDSNQKIILASANVKFVHDLNMTVAYFAILNQKRINNFYTAHDPGVLTYPKLFQEKADWKQGNIKESDLYLFKVKDLPFDKTIYGDPFDDAFLKSSVIQHGKLSATKNKITRQTCDSVNRIVNLVKNESLVILSSKGSNMQCSLDTALVHSINSSLKTHFSAGEEQKKSYAAIFSNGVLLTEIHESTDSIFYTNTVGEYLIAIKSCIHPEEMVSSIQINGFNYSLNQPGLNIVSISKNQLGESIVNVGNIDLFEKNTDAKKP